MPITEELAGKLKECAEKQDFEGAFSLVRSNQSELAKQLQAEAVRDELKKTTNDRLLLSFLDGAGFDETLLFCLNLLEQFFAGAFFRSLRNQFTLNG